MSAAYIMLGPPHVSLSVFCGALTGKWGAYESSGRLQIAGALTNRRGAYKSWGAYELLGRLPIVGVLINLGAVLCCCGSFCLSALWQSGHAVPEGLVWW